MKEFIFENWIIIPFILAALYFAVLGLKIFNFWFWGINKHLENQEKIIELLKNKNAGI